MATPTRENLTAALKDAASAHHDYETRVLNGVRDEAWAGWYAGFVVGRLGNFIEAGRLAELLTSAPAGADWNESAAGYVLNNL